MVGGGPLRLRCARYAQAPLPRGEASRQAASSHSGAAASFSLCGHQKRPLALPLGELAAVRPSERGLSAKLTEKALHPPPTSKAPSFCGGGGPLRLRCARYAQAPLPRGEASRQAASSHSGAAASFSLCGYQKRPLALPLGELAAVRPSERGLSAKLTEKGLQPHLQAKPPLSRGLCFSCIFLQ